MADTWDRLREHVKDLVTRCPRFCLQENELYSDMINMRSIPSGRKMDFTVACTVGEPEGCRLLTQLTVLNEFFWVVDMDVREINRGRFGLCRLHSHYFPVASDKQKRHAHVLLHWLLTKHRCVEFVEVPETDAWPCPIFSWRGLSLSEGLKHVKFFYYSLELCRPRELLCTLGDRITTIDTLEIVNMLFINVTTGELCDLLDKCELLRTLVLLKICIDPTEADALIISLASHHSLRVLHIDEIFVKGDCCHSLGYLVSCSAHVEELTLIHSPPSPESYSYRFSPLFCELSHHDTQLKRLTISRFILNLSDLEDLSSALIVNKRLQDLTLLCSGAFQGVYFSIAPVIMHNKSLVDICVNGRLLNKNSIADLATAIKGNETIKNVVLHKACLTAEEAMELLCALTVNTSLRTLYLGIITQPGIALFLEEITHRGQCGRLDFTAAYSTANDLISTLNSTYKPSSIHFEPSGTVSMPELQGISSGLCGKSFLTSLRVQLPQKVNTNMAMMMSAVFRSWRCLSEAWLDFQADGSEIVVLLKGIGRSRSLSELVVRGWRFTTHEAAAFSGMLRDMTSLNSVAFGKFSMESMDVLVTELPRGLASNYTVLTVSDCKHPDYNSVSETNEYLKRGQLLINQSPYFNYKKVFEINECLRRNLSLLHQASCFVIAPASNSKDAAAAFEKVQHSSVLLAEVARSAGLTKAEAEKLVRRRRWYLDVNFLAIAGVVKEKVECPTIAICHHAAQFDELYLDVWLKIRRYLSLDDILNDDTRVDADDTLHERKS